MANRRERGEGGYPCHCRCRQWRGALLCFIASCRLATFAGYISDCDHLCVPKGRGEREESRRFGIAEQARSHCAGISVHRTPLSSHCVGIACATAGDLAAVHRKGGWWLVGRLQPPSHDQVVAPGKEYSV